MVDPIMKALRAHRRAREVSQQALADAIGVTRATITRWETGTRTPRLSDVSRYALATDADLHIEIKET